MKKKTHLFLLVANGILVILGWVMAFYAYPRLPQEMPLWINFFKQQVILTEKSPLFFLYPLVQTLFCFGFWWLSRVNFPVDLLTRKKEGLVLQRKNLIMSLRKEYIYLNLIFFNLIFIHLQRSIIFLAHDIGKGVNKIYFISVFIIILMLIPWYRLRKRLLIHKSGRGRV
ncbi:MAG: hypothetical protein GTO17_12555 [Candidatus Aminicenantes bacterium]|nr:hypothetical protein [Candidatus Aminicenantes bacterium]